MYEKVMFLRLVCMMSNKQNRMFWQHRSKYYIYFECENLTTIIWENKWQYHC